MSYVFVGVDEVTIINILTNRSNEQRQDIAFAYQRRTKKVAKYEEIPSIKYFYWGQIFQGLYVSQLTGCKLEISIIWFMFSL